MEMNFSDELTLAGRNTADGERKRGTAAVIYDSGWGECGVALPYGEGDIFYGGGECAVDAALECAERVLYVRPSGGSAASCIFGRARYAGAGGNEISIVCRHDADGSYEVCSYAGMTQIDTQTVLSAGELDDNDFVIFDRESELFPCLCMPMTGGENAVLSDAGYEELLSAFDSFDFDVFACCETAGIRASAAISYVNVRRERGKLCRCVIRDDINDITDLTEITGTDNFFVITAACKSDATSYGASDRASDMTSDGTSYGAEYTLYYTAGLAASALPGHTFTGMSIPADAAASLLLHDGAAARGLAESGRFAYARDDAGDAYVYMDVNCGAGAELLRYNSVFTLRDELFRRIRELYDGKYRSTQYGEGERRLLTEEVGELLRGFAVRSGALDADGISVSVSCRDSGGGDGVEADISVSAPVIMRIEGLRICASVK